MVMRLDSLIKEVIIAIKIMKGVNNNLFQYLTAFIII